MLGRPRSLPGLRSAAIAVLLVAVSDHVAVARLELDREAAAAELLAGDQGRARAGEGVEHRIAAAAAVPQLGGDQRHRLHARVQLAARRPVDEEDRALGIVAMPAAAGVPAATGPPGTRAEAVEDVLVLKVVVGASEHRRLLDPDQALVELPAEPFGHEPEGGSLRPGRDGQ